MLMLICMFVCGAYFCTDFPGELETFIIKDFNVSTTVYGLLYAIYSFPNMVIPLFSGVILLKLGKGYSLLIFVFLVALGQFIMIFGPMYDAYYLCIVGRGIFGIGCETMNVI